MNGPGSRVEIRRATVADLDSSAAVLGAAFADYPWTRWTVDADDHVIRITALQRLALAHYGLAFGHVWLALVEGMTASVAVWLDSGVVVPRDVDDLLGEDVARLEGSRHAASLGAEAELDGWRPRERHYFLATVGTLPTRQGRGLGRAVLGPALAAADEDGVAAALETSSIANVDFYARLGFEVVERRTITGGGPEVWMMIRPPGR